MEILPTDVPASQLSSAEKRRRGSLLEQDLGHVMRESQDRTRQRLLAREATQLDMASAPASPERPERITTVQFQPDVHDSPHMEEEETVVAMIPEDAIYFGSKRVQCHVKQDARVRRRKASLDPLDLSNYSPADIKTKSNYIIADVSVGGSGFPSLHLSSAGHAPLPFRCLHRFVPCGPGMTACPRHCILMHHLHVIPPPAGVHLLS